MPVDYKKDQMDNEEFDKAIDSVSPEGKYQKPPLENIREGVKIKKKQNLNIDLNKTWQGAKTVENWYDPFDVGAAAAANTIEFLAPQNWQELHQNIVELAASGHPVKWAGSKLIKEIPVVKDSLKTIRKSIDNVWAQRRIFRPNTAAEGPFTGNWVTQDSLTNKPLMSKGDQYVQGNLPVERFQSVPYQKKVTSAMNEFGMSGGIFDLRTYNLRKSLKTPTQRRVFLEHYLSPDFIKGRFSGFDKANRPGFAQKWADFLKAKGLDPVGDIQIHHINPLHDSIHLFDGIKFNSKEYWDVIETLIDANARTGVIHRGEDVQNLMMTLGKGAVEGTPHGIAHKFLNSITPTFFSKAEMKLMKKNPAYRIQKAKDWAKIVNKAEQVILEGHRQWSLLNPKLANELPFEKFNSELVNRLTEYTDQGYSKLIDPNFQLSDFNNIIQEILTTPGKRGPKTNYLKKIEKLGEKQGIHFDSETGTGTIQGDLFDQ